MYAGEQFEHCNTLVYRWMMTNGVVSHHWWQDPEARIIGKVVASDKTDRLTLVN